MMIMPVLKAVIVIIEISCNEDNRLFYSLFASLVDGDHGKAPTWWR